MAWTVEIAGVQDTEVVARIGRETFMKHGGLQYPGGYGALSARCLDHDKVRKDLANSEVNTSSWYVMVRGSVATPRFVGPDLSRFGRNTSVGDRAGVRLPGVAWGRIGGDAMDAIIRLRKRRAWICFG